MSLGCSHLLHPDVVRLDLKPTAAPSVHPLPLPVNQSLLRIYRSQGLLHGNPHGIEGRTHPGSRDECPRLRDASF